MRNLVGSSRVESTKAINNGSFAAAYRSKSRERTQQNNALNGGRAISPAPGRIPTNQAEAMALRVKNGLREARAELDRDFDDVLTKID